MTATQLKDLMDQSHRFMHMMGRIYHFYDRQAKSPMLHPGQSRLLFLIQEKQPVGQKDLAFLLDIRPSSLSELLKKLEEKGLITRRAGEEDKRNMIVALTEEGKALAQKIAAGKDELETMVFAALSETELRQFHFLLGKLMDSWQETLEAAGDSDGPPHHGPCRGPHRDPSPEHGSCHDRPGMFPGPRGHHRSPWGEDFRSPDWDR